MQYPVAFTPEIRNSFDYIFLASEGNIFYRKQLWQNYGRMMPFEAFDHIYNKCATNYGFMVIDNKLASKNVDDKIFWYKAEK